MPSYTAPGVYVQDISSGSQTITQESSSIGILIGTCRSGLVGVPQKIGSWTEFISKYANGLDTPFDKNSYLPYCVNGFFMNGGRELYVLRVSKSDAVKATVTSTSNGITVTAASEGEWGNSIRVSLEAGEEDLFNVTIAVGVEDSVTIYDVTRDSISSAVMSNSKAKLWLSEFEISDTITTLQKEAFSLSGGSDGGTLMDSDYIEYLDKVGLLDDVTFVAVPGQTSKVMNDALLAYCDEHELFPFLDMSIGSTDAETKTYRRSISAFTGALCYPWGKVNDPLTDSLKLVPTCGHVMGVYARTIESRGVHKAPAGVDAVVRGFVEMEQRLTPTQIGTLNPIGVICIVSKPNAGIVVWGARGLNSTDTKMRYVTDGLLNLNIKKSIYNGTQFAVFEPNDKVLWAKVRAACKSFLESLRSSGALKGTAEEAYYVTVDRTNNTPDTIDEGQLNIEIGYAPVKPAEFVIVKLAHSIESNT